MNVGRLLKAADAVDHMDGTPDHATAYLLRAVWNDRDLAPRITAAALALADTILGGTDD